MRIFCMSENFSTFVVTSEGLFFDCLVGNTIKRCSRWNKWTIFRAANKKGLFYSRKDSTSGIWIPHEEGGKRKENGTRHATCSEEEDTYGLEQEGK